MTTNQSPLPPIPVPFDGTPDELIRAAREVAELREHPGYRHLIAAAEGYAAMIDNRLATEAPSSNPAHYADAVGERRGLRATDRLALGVIENAKAAERVSRADEERGN